MKRLASLIPAIFVFAFATDAQAGARIVTPGFVPPQDGRAECRVVNASAKKEIQVEITIHSGGGHVVAGPSAWTISPNAHGQLLTGDDAAGHCVVVVVKGGRKNVRVTFVAYHDIALQEIAAAVSGF